MFRISNKYFNYFPYICTNMQKKRYRYMEKLNRVLALGLCGVVFLAIIHLFTTCSVPRRIQWHEDQLDRYEKLYPELFTTAGIDSIIKARAVQLVAEMSKDIDKNKADSLQNEFDKLLSSVKSLKESAQPCDTILKEVERIVEVQGKQKVVYMESKCKIDTVTKDTLGVKLKLWSNDGKLYADVDVDSLRFKYDCPLEPKCVERKFWQFWEFWICPAFLLFLMIIIARRRL